VRGDGGVIVVTAAWPLGSGPGKRVGFPNTLSPMELIAALTPHYRLDSNPDGGGEFLENHCENCQEPIEEELLHEHLDSPFGPLGAEISAGIQPLQVREPFEASVGAAAHE
jgi:hypothetical protein